jgi:hypothetical protein
MGIGRASGEDRATVAIKQAINSPLLDTTIDGATGVILNFTGGRGMRLSEIDSASSIVRQAAAPEAEIIVGAVVDDSLEDELMITVIASGFDGTINASAGHRASTSVLSRENPTLITSRQPAATQPRTDFTPRQPEPAPAPVPVQRAQPGFRFGDDSVAQPAPGPVQQVPVQQVPIQQVPVQQMPVQQPGPAPVQQQPVQMGGRPQANVAPQTDEKAQKSAKPWFMFGKDGQ